MIDSRSLPANLKIYKEMFAQSAMHTVTSKDMQFKVQVYGGLLLHMWTER